jgi:predicted esterase
MDSKVRAVLAFVVCLASFVASDLARADAAPSSPPPAEPQPLPAISGGWLQAEGDLGFVAPPIGATDRRPVVVAVHGMGDRPEWECGAWRAVFGPRPFILCPRGRPWQVNFAWRSSDHVRQSIDAILDAAVARFGAHVDRTHSVYVGFSQGAIMGARALRGETSLFSYAIFQEGFDDALAGRPLGDALAKSGITRVLFGCSQGGCTTKRVPLRAALTRVGIDARVNDAGPRGHTIDEVVVRSVRRDIPWLLGGDDLWSDVVRDVNAGG